MTQVVLACLIYMGDGVDRGESRSAGADRCAPPAPCQRGRSRCAGLGTDISRRAAGRAARRTNLPHLAAARGRADTEHRCDARLAAAMPKPVRERPDRAGRTPPNGRCAVTLCDRPYRRCDANAGPRPGVHRRACPDVGRRHPSRAGILTSIYKSPLALALTHQGMAMVALTIAVVHANRLVVKRLESRVSVMTSLSTY